MIKDFRREMYLLWRQDQRPPGRSQDRPTAFSWDLISDSCQIKSLKDVKQKMIDFANCHLPGFEFPFCLLVVLLRAFSMRNGSATCVYMLRCCCLQLLSNAVEVFSKSVDSTKRRRTRKHANSCSSSKRGNAYCGFATGIMVKFLFSHIFIQLRK